MTNHTKTQLDTILKLRQELQPTLILHNWTLLTTACQYDKKCFWLRNQMLANLNLPEDEGLNPQPNLTKTQTPDY